jgi:uncharacterized protein
MSKPIVIAAVASAELEPEPISPSAILTGAPEARSKRLAESHDRTSSVMVWECSGGRFNWHYAEDEIAFILSGEVFIANEKGEERRLGPGDMIFFPAGSCCTWRVTDRIKKIAVLRKDLPPPLGFCVRAWHKLLRMVGLKGGSSLMPAAVLSASQAAAQTI